MSIDDIVTAIIYLIAVFIIFTLAKWVYDVLNRHFKLNEELLIKDNFAVAISVTGYYLGIVIAIGGTIVGPTAGIIEDLIDIFFYGILAVLAMNFSIFVNNKIILYKFDNVKEIIEDRNAGTGVVEFGNHVAVGLIIYGAISGEGGNMLTALVFWLLGLTALILAGLVYNFITPYDIHEHIEKDNVAVGIAFAGVLLGMGNIVRFSLSGDFTSWSENLLKFGIIVVLGLVLLPAIRWVTDVVLLPGQKLTRELVAQEKPNLGAASIEALSYVASSFLIGWCF